MIESSNGAKASAILYSLVETAKANMINTFEYFNLLLTDIPQHMDDKDLRFIDDLLPWLIIPGLFEPPVRTLRATIPENESHIFR